MSERHVKERLLKSFNFNEPDNISDSLTIPLQLDKETPIASINLDGIHSNDRVYLRANVEYQIANSSTSNPEIRVLIRRDVPPGILVFSSVDTANTANQGGRRYTKMISYAETGLTEGGHTYTLLAQIATGNNNQIAVFGPVDLSGSIIDENDT